MVDGGPRFPMSSSAFNQWRLFHCLSSAFSLVELWCWPVFFFSSRPIKLNNNLCSSHYTWGKVIVILDQWCICRCWYRSSSNKTTPALIFIFLRTSSWETELLVCSVMNIGSAVLRLLLLDCCCSVAAVTVVLLTFNVMQAYLYISTSILST